MRGRSVAWFEVNVAGGQHGASALAGSPGKTRGVTWPPPRFGGASEGLNGRIWGAARGDAGGSVRGEGSDARTGIAIESARGFATDTASAPRGAQLVDEFRPATAPRPRGPE